tara:strand:- start:797 stop:1021 length:225 start_codon:yes stop_codon:yes gene_type:complete
MPEPTKPWYLSKGVVGGLIAGATIIFGLLNRPEMGEAVGAESENISQIIASVVGVIASITAVIGRIKASSKIVK